MDPENEYAEDYQNEQVRHLNDDTASNDDDTSVSQNQENQENIQNADVEQQEVLQSNMQGSLQEVIQMTQDEQASGQQERDNAATAYPESWDKEAKAFVWEKDGTLYKRKNDDDADKRPEQIDDENWEEVAAENRNFTFDDGTGGELIVDPLLMERIDMVEPNQIKKLNPKGDKVREIIQKVCHESWEFMTKNLNKDGETEDPEKKSNRKNLLQKVWEYRQWHHNFILNKTKSALGDDQLTDWAAAGSATLTSDIDVNLKGTDTEAAVQKFNELFKADGWKYEAGVVYDVNVYALDFMHKEYTFGKGMVDKEMVGGEEVTKDLHGNVLKRKDTTTDQTTENNTTMATGVVAKEGARAGKAEGGFDAANADVIDADIKDQEIWTYVKSRLYMNQSDWDSYAESINLNAETKAKVEARFNEYTTNMKNQMLADSPKDEITQVVDETLTGIQQLQKYAEESANQDQGEHQLEADTAQMMIGGSNRIYEQKLAEVSKLRGTLKSQVAQYDAIVNKDEITEIEQQEADLINLAIDQNLQLLRNMLAEAALYSNEAYITDGAVNHAVVGMQIGAPIEQSNNESMNAVVENMADCLKEIGRHDGTLGEAAFKSGKYMFRLADAALNMGYSAQTIRNLYKAGDEISVELKKNVQDPDEQKTRSAAEIQMYFPGVDSPDKLKDKIKELTADITNWKTTEEQQNVNFGKQKSNAVGTNQSQ